MVRPTLSHLLRGAPSVRGPGTRRGPLLHGRSHRPRGALPSTRCLRPLVPSAWRGGVTVSDAIERAQRLLNGADLWDDDTIADVLTGRSALHHGDLRRAVTNQQRARINSAAARAAYTAWLEVRT